MCVCVCVVCVCVGVCVWGVCVVLALRGSFFGVWCGGVSVCVCVCVCVWGCRATCCLFTDSCCHAVFYDMSVVCFVPRLVMFSVCVCVCACVCVCVWRGGEPGTER